MTHPNEVSHPHTAHSTPHSESAHPHAGGHPHIGGHPHAGGHPDILNGEMPENMPKKSLRMAVIDNNVLACRGLQGLLQRLIPIATVETFESHESLLDNEPEQYAHFFVSARIYFEHSLFYRQQPFQTIVLTNGENMPPVPGLLMLNVCRSEEEVVTDLLQLHNHGHGKGQHRPRASKAELEALWNGNEDGERQPLTLREIEVATLLAKGFINKEVADQLNISMTTVITHRKNIMTKLGAHSLSDIIIYVVMNGYLDLGE